MIHYKPELRIDNKPLLEDGFMTIRLYGRIFWIHKRLMEQAAMLPLAEAQGLINQFKKEPTRSLNVQR